MSRLRIALVIYAILAAVAWFTLTDQRIRIITVAILAMFAVRTLTFSRRRSETRDDHDLDQ